MTDLIWSDRAVDDLQAIRRFWITRDPQLRVDLDEALSPTSVFLLESPVGRSNRRKWRIGRTPFLLFYTIRAEVLRIGRVRHQRENWLRAH